MGLEHLINLLWADVAVVIEGVKTLGKGLLAVGAEIALMPIEHFAVFVRLRVTTEPIFHCFSSSRQDCSTLPNPHQPDALSIIFMRINA